MSSASKVKMGKAFILIEAVDKTALVLRRVSHKFKAWGGRMQQIGKSAMMKSFALLGPTAMATKIFADFDDQMRTVMAVTGATGDQFKALTEQAKLLGRTTSFTAAQVAGGMVELGRAGFDPSQIAKATPAVLALARATGTELAEATNIAANTLRSFGLEASAMGRVSDVLTATANNSAQTLTDIGESMKYVAPVAAEAGMSLEQTAKAVGALANFGIKGSMAGTTLKNILNRMADPAVIQQFDALGVATTDAAGNLRPLADIMADVGKAVEGMPNAQRLKTFNDLFGMRAIAGGSKLTTANFERLNTSIDKAGGTAARTAKIMDSGLGGSFRKAWSAIEGVAIAVGEALAPALSRATEIATGWLGTITEWIGANKELVTWVVAAGAAVAAGGAAFVALGGLLSIVGTAIGGIAALVGAIISPFGLTVIAVSAAGLALFRFSETARTAMRSAWSTVSEFVGRIRETFSGIWTGMSDALKGNNVGLAMKIAWAGAKVAWMKATNGLLDKFSYFWAEIRILLQRGATWLAKATMTMWTGIRIAWTVHTLALKMIFLDLFDFIMVGFNNIKRGLKGMAFAMIASGNEELQKVGGRLLDAVASMEFYHQQVPRWRKEAIKKNKEDLLVIGQEQKAAMGEFDKQEAAAIKEIEGARDKEIAARPKDLAAEEDELDWLKLEARIAKSNAAHAAFWAQFEKEGEGAPAGKDAPAAAVLPRPVTPGAGRSRGALAAISRGTVEAFNLVQQLRAEGGDDPQRKVPSLLQVANKVLGDIKDNTAKIEDIGIEGV